MASVLIESCAELSPRMTIDECSWQESTARRGTAFEPSYSNSKACVGLFTTATSRHGEGREQWVCGGWSNDRLAGTIVSPPSFHY